MITKKRINISVSKDIDTAVSMLAKRDQVPTATKVAHLLALALEIEEDQVLDAIAAKRDTARAKYVSHALAWR
jgi:energy-converting hydrogenase A subunit M